MCDLLKDAEYKVKFLQNEVSFLTGKNKILKTENESLRSWVSNIHNETALQLDKVKACSPITLAEIFDAKIKREREGLHDAVLITD